MILILIIFFVLVIVAILLTTVTFGDKSKKNDSPASKQKVQWKVPECPPQLFGWLFIIVVGMVCVYGIRNLSSNMFTENGTTESIKVTRVDIEPFGTKTVFFDPKLNHIRFTIPKTKKTIIRYLSKDGRPIRALCNGQWVYEYLSTGSNKTVKRFEDNTTAGCVVFESASSQNGSYSFNVEEYNR